MHARNGAAPSAPGAAGCSFRWRRWLSGESNSEPSFRPISESIPKQPSSSSQEIWINPPHFGQALERPRPARLASWDPDERVAVVLGDPR
eukprot:4797716-Pyramimonas_sp.AAC.1